MMRAGTAALLGTLTMLGCAGGATPDAGMDGTGAPGASAPPPAAAEVACAPQRPTAGRASSYDSTAIALGGATAKVCYGRPSARGRPVFGQLVPYGSIWRTGANEPTIVHTPVPARIAGIAVQPGSYSLYTIPGEREWTVIVNRAISQWGHESRYTAEVQAQEVGRATVPVQRTDSPVETFQIRSAPAGAGSDLLLEWENTRVRVPVTRG